MLAEIENVLIAEQPDALLVYGDTNSTLAGALAAVKLRIPVAHVEAGLRSFNMAMPEEINRILTDRISKWLYTPTELAAQHLRREGGADESIVAVGDVMYDAACHYGARVDAEGRMLERLALEPKNYVLATVHRAENTDEPKRLLAIVEAFKIVGRNLPVVWPMHPRARRVLQELGKLEDIGKAVLVIEPAGYLDMVQLEKYAAAIATDSGGVQKEAFFYQVPCVTLRDETEWMELVSAGWNRLAPPNDSESLADEIKSAVGSIGEVVYPYGNGAAAIRIVNHLESGIR
jgi:UDP-GlcNAc3NAcA epimerase